jgi:hypothetical protein
MTNKTFKVWSPEEEIEDHAWVIDISTVQISDFKEAAETLAVDYVENHEFIELYDSSVEVYVRAPDNVLYQVSVSAESQVVYTPGVAKIVQE